MKIKNSYNRSGLTHTHTYTHTRTHAHACAHTYTHIRTRTHTTQFYYLKKQTVLTSVRITLLCHLVTRSTNLHELFNISFWSFLLIITNNCISTVMTTHTHTVNLQEEFALVLHWLLQLIFFLYRKDTKHSYNKEHTQ